MFGLVSWGLRLFRSNRFDLVDPMHGAGKLVHRSPTASPMRSAPL